MAGDPVTMHVLAFVQGHHSAHSTEFVLTSEGGDPDRAEDVIARVRYQIHGVQLTHIEAVAQDMGVIVLGPMVTHEPRGWVNHTSYRGRRSVVGAG